MRVGFGLLADHAVALTDGKLYITGAGLDQVGVSTLPARLPEIAVALKLYFERAECGTQHVLEVIGRAPSGSVFAPLMASAFVPRLLEGGEESPVPLVWNLRDIQFSEGGLHTFTVVLDGNEALKLLLQVRQVANLAGVVGPAAVDPISELLNLAFTEFRQGEVHTARETLVKLLQRYPMSALGHNNLGFVKLVERDPKGALEEFGRAVDLGFSVNGLLQVNVGCAHHALGEYVQAVEAFEKARGSLITTLPAVLLALGRDQMSVASVMTVQDFQTLVCANAGWSSLALGDFERAKAYLAAATVRTEGRSEPLDAPLTHALSQLAAAVAS